MNKPNLLKHQQHEFTKVETAKKFKPSLSRETRDRPTNFLGGNDRIPCM